MVRRQEETGTVTKIESYLARMRDCAAALGRELAPISDQHREVRLVAREAELAEQGFASGLLSIVDRNRVRTSDPHQDTAWLVEGNPARLCWEYLPHIAAYVELIDELGYPKSAVRFETPDDELRLDLAAVSPDGRVLVLGEAKAEARQLTTLHAGVQNYAGDPGFPSKAMPQREAQKLAHQLWVTRAPYLWLVASGGRLAFDVTYGDRITLRARAALPAVHDLWPHGFQERTPPRLLLPDENADVTGDMAEGRNQ